MDVMKPYLYYVDGRCYRRMAIKYPKYNDEIMNDDISQLNAENEICEGIEGVVITEETSESVLATLNIANSYFGYIVGRKKETKHRLEKETNTKITVPNQEERLPVTVKGETKYSVMSCARRIMMIVNAARLHQSFTHFLSIPFTASEIVANFENFKDSVLKECLECNNICKDLFQNPNRLHLTVGTLVLMNENERKIARELLHQCKESVVLPILKKDLSNVSCRLHGIEIMNDDPANVNVLYGKVEFDSVEELDRFQQFVDKVCEHFETSGLLINKFEHVKLHVTLLNNVFQHGSDSEEVSDKIGDGETNKQRRVPFDARKILKKIMLPQVLFRQSVSRCMRLTSVPLRLSHHKHDAKDEYQTITITYPKGSNINPSTPVLPRPQEKAPDFKSQAVISRKISEIKLSDYKGKWLILFFYPMDFTFVCPTEIIAFNDRAGEFKEINCELIACSTDSHFSHFGWINTPRKEGGLGEMKIPIMADFTKSISRSYGVLLEKDGIALRGLFLIDPHGILKHVSVNDLPVGRSVDEALRLVKAFQFFEKHGEVCPANWKPDGPTIKPNVDQAKEYFSKVK